ncbi:hypothetical protein MTO96_006862 [Rhipicephalus appendiculatus]
MHGRQTRGSLERISLEVLRNGSLEGYAATLRALHLNSLLKLCYIEPGVFDNLHELREMRITHSGLREVPYMHDLNPSTYIGMLDLSETSLTKLPTRGLESLEVLELRDAPALREFPSVYHFRFIRVAHLTYPYHCCAFQFPETHDPEEHSRFQKHCNSDDETMKQRQNRPPVVGEEHDFQLLERFFVVQLNNKHTTTPPTRRFVRHVFSEFGTIHGAVASSRALRLFQRLRNLEPRTLRPAHGASSTLEAWREPFTPEVRLQEEQWVTCGKLASRRVQCFPTPDALNPCEDVMGNMVLRVAVWFVVVAAVFGNLAVLLVLLSSRLTVSKFLMCNLAFADLCMGAYLLLIAAEDLHTRGRYFSHAILWQHGAGCKVAGFLTVFASELSIYTLTVITLERWYAITYAVHLNRRLRLRTAARIMACGWGYALLAASLPLLGISSYSKTSICLPMENSTVADFLYLLTLLSMNGFAFLLICACYAKMYLAISGQRPRSHCGSKDTSVAKRMAMLVFTDFACWAPHRFLRPDGRGRLPAYRRAQVQDPARVLLPPSTRAPTRSSTPS